MILACQQLLLLRCLLLFFHVSLYSRFEEKRVYCFISVKPLVFSSEKKYFRHITENSHLIFGVQLQKVVPHTLSDFTPVQHLPSIIPPQTKFRGYIVILMSVRSSFVRSFFRPSVPPSQFLIRYSSKTAEKNFMKLSGIVHYIMPYCTSYFKFLFE